MSWHKQLGAVTLDEIDAAQLTEEEAFRLLLPEAISQFEKAKAMAKQLIQSGVVGDPSTNKFFVNLSGHANPQHEETTGYANDCVSINVSQAMKRAGSTLS